MKTDVLIVGGGLSGLALADALQTAGRDYLLVEARDRFGGRISGAKSDAATYDLGPAWFWPGQPLMESVVRRFDLNVFEQHYTGELTAENERGQVQRGRGFSSMRGSHRVDGGMPALIDAFVNTLPMQRLIPSSSVRRLAQHASGVTAELRGGAGIEAQDVVLALPPRLAAETLAFDPALPDNALRAMSDIATWMAGQAKAVAVYDSPFWRADGLSGDAMSRLGPMVEIHDASPVTGQEGALFGFVGVPPAARLNEDALRAAIAEQLARLFGPQAADYKALFVKDWASDPATSTEADARPLYAHPQYGLPASLKGLWDGRLHFAGTEVAPHHGGFLEGALEAADIVARHLSDNHARARAS